MRVFVAGGTGAVGRPAVRALIENGHEVTALARSREKADWLDRQSATPSWTSLFDREALTTALAGHDAVINLATAIPPMSRFVLTRAWRDNDRIRSEGSAALVDAALEAGVGRLIQESVSMLYPDCGSQWIDEDVPADPFPIARGNLAAEASVARFSSRSGAGVALRFAWFYGPGARHSEQLLALARLGIGTVMGAADGYVSSIHMEDAGSAVVAALDVAPGTYNVADDEPLTKRDYAAAMEAAVGRRMWVRAPGRAALAFGDRVTSLTRSLRVSNERLRANGWAPAYPSAREGWAATAASLGQPSSGA